MRIAERMDRFGTETAFEVLVKAKALEAQGRDIIHLEFGEPDFASPANVIEAGVACLCGTAFGAAGEGYLRFSYANSSENIRKALERIKTAVERIQD